MYSTFLLHFGALTSKPYAFSARPWELDSVEHLDFFDSFGSHIRLDTRGGVVMRVLPRINEELNEEWISDKVRFSYDGFRKQRLDLPLSKLRLDEITSNLIFFESLEDLKLSNVLSYREKPVPVSWEEVFELLALFVPVRIGGPSVREPTRALSFLFGKFVDFETLLFLKEFFMGRQYFSTLDRILWNSRPPSLDIRSHYLSPPFSAILSSDLLVLVGLNTRIDLPVFNLRLRRQVKSGLKLFLLGSSGVGGGSNEYGLGVSSSVLLSVAEGRHPICRLLSSRSLILIGEGVLRREDSGAIFRLVRFISEFSGSKFGLLNTASGPISASELGFPASSPLPTNSTGLLWVLSNDEVEVDTQGYDLIVYQGHHGDRSAVFADLLLPSPLPIEKRATFLNYEGAYQTGRYVVPPPPGARADWKILSMLAREVGVVSSFPYPSLPELRRWAEIRYGSYNGCTTSRFSPKFSEVGPAKLNRTPIHPPLSNFYLNDSISRASSVMAISANRLLQSSNSFDF